MTRSPHRDAPYWVHSDPTEPGENMPAGIPPEHGYADPCPGRCNRHWRNADRIDPEGNHYDRDGQLIEPTPGQPVWCRPCADAITGDLQRLPDLAAAAGARADGRLNTGTGDTDATRHGTRTGSPSGSPAFDTIDSVAAWAADWVDELAEHLAHATRGGAGTRARVANLTGNVAYLAAHATPLLCADDLAVRFGRETHQLAKLLEHASGGDRLRHRLPAPCPSCDRRALVRDDGSEQVDCTACKRAWPESDYRRLTLILASDHREGRTA